MPDAYRSRRALAVALLATALVGAGFAAWLLGLPSAEAWAGLTPGDCPEYCEASDRCGAPATRSAVQQPANTWSNLAYVFVGVWALAARPSALGAVFAFSCLWLGVGSLLFHASVTREHQWLDVTGMYVALGAVAARALHDAFRLRASRTIAAWAIVSGLLAVFKWRIDTTLAMVALGLVVGAGAVRRVRAGRLGTGAALLPLALIAVGYGVRALDVSRAVCDPASLLQGHALWHALAAASLLTAWWNFDADAGDHARTPKRLPEA